MKVTTLFLLAVYASPSYTAADNDEAAQLPTKSGNLRSLQQQLNYNSEPAVSCDTCPCGYFDGCNNCGCSSDGGPSFCTLRFCFPEELEEPSCNPCDERCCDLSDRPQGDDEAPLCCPDGSWASNIGDGTAICPNGELVTSNENEGTVCQPTCDDCPCGYNDGCNECMCTGPDGLASCTERACLVQGTPSCKECPVKSDECCDPLMEPGRFGNPPAREGYQCCGATGEWLGSIGDGRTIFCGGQLISSGYGEPCYETKCCDLDARPQGGFEAPLCCPDGSWAGNIGDGSGTCPSGLVVRSGVNEGELCEKEEPLACCDLDARPQGSVEAPLCCPDGSWAPNIGNGSGTCPSGLMVRSGVNEGELCENEESKCCDLDARPQGSIEAPLCCPDGSWAPNIGNGSGTCPSGLVVRSGMNEGELCEKEEPTACCDLAARPQGSIESPLCCPDGSWAPNIGNGSGTCPSGLVVRSGMNEGELCEKEGPAACCDLTARPQGSIEAPLCCPDGSWAPNIGNGSGTCPSGLVVRSGMNEGELCEKVEPTACCDLAARPQGSIESPLCCPDGSWAPNIGNGSGTCRDGSIVRGGVNEGEICEATCESCPCGYNDGCNDCSCGADGDVIGCTERACLLQGPPSCLECTREPLCCDPLKEPGQFGNGIGREGYQCCAATGEWAFSIGDARTYLCGGEYVTSGFGERCYEPSCCDPQELPGANGGPIPFETPLCCFDGTWVGNRGDGRGECRGMIIDESTQGEICEQEQTFCTQDVKTCPNGSFVGRDPANGCSFFPCPKTCRRRYRWCGYRRGWVGLDPTKDCKQFKPCRQY